MNMPLILIIEDNPISLKMLKITLESDHYTVVEAVDATSGLREASSQHFDLIIQDLILPDMDGFVLNQKLRELPTVEDIPIFILSGFLNQHNTLFSPSDITLFLLKPISPSYLLDVVKAHLPISSSSTVLLGNGKHILIADDNAMQLKLLSMQLKNSGFTVTTAQDGKIALKIALLKHPDAIISDVLMPNLDGFGLCLEIKRDPSVCHIPVILISSHYLEKEDLVLAKKAGASCYLTRTPNEQYLILELVKLLNTTSAELDAPLELTDDIKEKHTIRSIRQLEQQVVDNSYLTQQCAMLRSQLSLIDGIANAITTSSKNMDESFKELLFFCLDAVGISKGALYIKKSHNQMILSQQIGYNEDQLAAVKSFFGISKLLPEIIKNIKPIAIPSEHLTDQDTALFLDNAQVNSSFIVPLRCGTECLGLLFLGSDMLNVSDEHTSGFIHTIGLQFGQSIALLSAFDKLASSEKRYRQLVEISPDAIFIQQDEKFVYANSAALQLLNARGPDELLARSFYDFFPIDFQKEIHEYIQKDINQTADILTEGKIINLQGHILDVEMVICPFLYEEKEAVYMIMRDITERKRSALHLEIQYAIAWILAESATLFVATAKILKIICERLQWDCGIIWAVNAEANVLQCTRVWQMPHLTSTAFQEESQNFTFAPGEGLPGQTWQKRSVIWQSDLFHDKHFLRASSAALVGLNTAVLFPIIHENKVLGVIEFYSKNILRPNDDLLLWFSSIGSQFGLFLVRKHMEKQMLYLAEHDVLTGLSNRNLLEKFLDTAIATAKDRAERLAILFLDLDHFKYINDSMGHQAGDLLLQEVSNRFRICLRPEDTISRFGGDEFIIIIPNVQHNGEIIDIITRLQNTLAKQIILHDKEFSITVSIGVSIYPDDGNTVPMLIKSADIAMYAAKEKGRNNFQLCTPEMTIKAENRGILLNNLRDALEYNEFILFYQPKVDILSKKVVGVEALIRWNTPAGILSPGSFIAAAEGSDLIIPIGEWVFKNACLQNQIWQALGLPPITVSVNLSVLNLNQQLLELVEKTLLGTDLKPEYFEIELTESALMENVENNIQILCSLKEMGLKISIDDFGTGYSSLSYLKRFPIDTIKIDQSFIRDIANDSEDAAIVTAIIAMAHSLGFKVIAEGVETQAQLKFLCDHGCDEIQGFYFSRPLPASEALDFIQNVDLSWHFE